jgi:hypothetical protein
MKKLNFKSIFIGIIIGIMLTSSVFAVEEITQYIFSQSPHKLIVDGKEYSNPDIPINLFVYENRNYAPIAVIRDLALQLGVNFSFDANTKEIRINTSKIKDSKLNELSPQATASILIQNPEVRDTIDENGYAIWKGKTVRLNKDYLDGKIKVNLEEDNVKTMDSLKSPQISKTTSDGIELKLKYNNKGEYDENGNYYVNTTQIETKYKNKFNLENGYWFGRKLQQDNTTIMWMIYKGNTSKPVIENIPNFKGREIPLDYYENNILPLLK